MLGSAFDNAPVGIAVLASCGVVVLCNRALGAVLDRLLDAVLTDPRLNQKDRLLELARK